MKPKILSPAGSYEALQAAIKGGCDAVYFGIEQLNMRARSSNNFTTDDLRDIANRCMAAGVKTYITLNTVLFDHDIQLMKRIIEQAIESGIDAIIASDHAAMRYARSISMPVHISTQCNITNIDTVEFYADYADVMVLARELSLQQVAAISREIKRRDIKGPSGNLVEIEIFAHGALCMAVSGKCYLSLHSNNASANRGACIQNCRREYIVTDKEEGIELEIDNEYIMSAKDLCTIGFIDKIIDAGVSVLKIEGRGRAADYVFETTQCYREAVDAVAEGTYGKEKVIAWEDRLKTVYNRGFWDGYYLGRKIGEWSDVYGSKATTKKILLGRGIKYFAQAGVGEFEMESHQLNTGDTIMVTGPTTGIFTTIAEELYLEGKAVKTVTKGMRFSIKTPEKIRPSDKLYKIVAA